MPPLRRLGVWCKDWWRSLLGSRHVLQICRNEEPVAYTFLLVVPVTDPLLAVLRMIPPVRHDLEELYCYASGSDSAG
jgi:hypothetical protein